MDTPSSPASPGSPLFNRQMREINPCRVYFVRHGMSANNRTLKEDVRAGEKAVEGRQADPTITDVGAEQAAAAGRYFKALNADENVEEWKKVGTLNCSLMKRALMTAKEMAMGAEVDVVGWDDLYEEGGLFNGSREAEPSADNLVHGLTKEEMKALVDLRNLEEIKTYHGGWWKGGREVNEECEFRAKILAEKIWEIAASGQPRAHVFITHGLIHDRVKRMLITNGQGSSATDTVVFPTCNCGIDVFDFKINPETKERRLAVVQLNNDEYLPPQLRNGHTCGAFRI